LLSWLKRAEKAIYDSFWQRTYFSFAVPHAIVAGADFSANVLPFSPFPWVEHKWTVSSVCPLPLIFPEDGAGWIFFVGVGQRLAILVAFDPPRILGLRAPPSALVQLFAWTFSAQKRLTFFCGSDCSDQGVSHCEEPWRFFTGPSASVPSDLSGGVQLSPWKRRCKKQPKDATPFNPLPSGAVPLPGFPSGHFFLFRRLHWCHPAGINDLRLHVARSFSCARSSDCSL